MTTRLVRAFATVIGLLVLGLPPRVISGLADDRPSEEEYTIYNAVIEKLYVQRRSASLIVISKETESGPQPQPGKGPVIGVASPEEMQSAMKLIADLTPAYEAQNERPVKLKKSFNLPVDYVLVSKKKGLRLLAKDHDQPTHFSEAYPGSETVGLVGLSRVGFNADHTQALMYAAHWCGSGCGDGMFLVLQKENNQWNIRYQTIASVAEQGSERPLTLSSDHP